MVFDLDIKPPSPPQLDSGPSHTEPLHLPVLAQSLASPTVTTVDSEWTGPRARGIVLYLLFAAGGNRYILQYLAAIETVTWKQMLARSKTDRMVRGQACDIMLICPPPGLEQRKSYVVTVDRWEINRRKNQQAELRH